MMKAILARIAHGLLVGIGFALAMGAVMYGFSRWQLNEFEESAGMMYKEYTSEAGLVIKDHRPQRAEGNAAFLGTLANNGADAWQSVELLVELFDKDGVFVDKCSSYVDGSIAPGETRNFKVSCSTCRDPAQPLVYDRYTIVIADASYSAPQSEE